MSHAARYLPSGAAQEMAGAITVRAPSHSSGLAAWRPFYKEAVDRADARAQLMLVGPDVPPGTRYLYSDMNFMLLGMLVEKSCTALDRAFNSNAARPLRLVETRVHPMADVGAPLDEDDPRASANCAVKCTTRMHRASMA
ncbi:MAG: serine hydrolase domain-containing protein [Gemmatimonadaceae bacterium]|nr:serine hydrolase domain-containing protein [Gemmatimonadaceae bacterium]